MTKTDIVTLDSDQKARAQELLSRYNDGEINRPEDIVDEWGDPQTRQTHIEYDISTKNEYIDPREIVGRVEGETTHFEPAKAAQILYWLYTGEFDQFKRLPPTLEKRPEGYFVTTDGTHRCIVAKGLPLEKLYVEYHEIPASALEER